MSHSKHVAPSISPKRWEHLKSLGVGPGNMIHQSCDARMIEVPIEGTTMTKRVPWVQRPGVTYDVGRNKAKARRFSSWSPI